MTRVVLATGHPDLNAQIAGAPDVDVVADAYYTDAAATALSELHPDVAVIAGALPGSGLADLASAAATLCVRVVWVGAPAAASEDGGSRAHAARTGLPADADASSILAAIRGPIVLDEVASPAVAGAASGGLHVFLGCVPRLGVTTAAVAFALSARDEGVHSLLVDGNFAHPCLSELMGRREPFAGWETATVPADLHAVAFRVHGITCLPLGGNETCESNGGGWTERLDWILREVQRKAFGNVVVDLGAPRPLRQGRVARWLEWLGSQVADVNLLTAQDPQALLAAARMLRVTDAVGVPIRVWCASYDEHLSTIDEVSAALGRPCAVLPWDRRAVVLRALSGKPPGVRLAAAGAAAPVGG